MYILDGEENATIELMQLHTQQENRTVDPKAPKLPDVAKGDVGEAKAKESTAGSRHSCNIVAFATINNLSL